MGQRIRMDYPVLLKKGNGGLSRKSIARGEHMTVTDILPAGTVNNLAP
ncbi:MAG: hypothetical protein GXP46_08975 [Deferribacteres bacterium]|nr:hypothetical protein [Deferribacteres bacterium]